VILIKCFKARSKRKKLFNYDKTRKYTYIRIAGADKKQCEALQSLLDPKKRQHPLESMLRHCQFPTVYSLASLVPVVGGLLMALVGTMLVYRCLSRPGERLSHSKERYTEWRKCKNIMNESVNSNSLASIAGMEKLRKDQTLFLLLTAFITQVLSASTHSLSADLMSSLLSELRQILSLTVAGAILAPLINYIVQPLKKAARIIEIQIVIAIYFREDEARV
jgi:hypothetical protein